MKPKNIKKLQLRSRDLKVQRISRHKILVESASNPNTRYTVTVNFELDGVITARCNCPWSLFNGSACSHVMAALEHLANLKDRTLSFWSDESAARRQKHRTFVLKDTDDNAIWITSRAG